MKLTQDELTAIHKLQNEEHLSERDFICADVGAQKILAALQKIRRRAGVVHHRRGKPKTQVNNGARLCLFLKTPKTLKEIGEFMGHNCEHTTFNCLLRTRRDYGLCFCQVSQTHYQHLPEFDGMAERPTRLAHYAAILFERAKGKMGRRSLSRKIACSVDKASDVLTNSKKYLGKFKANPEATQMGNAIDTTLL